MRSFKNIINLGLIHIPISLYKVIDNKVPNFNLIDRNTMSRISYIKCTNNNKRIDTNIIKGVEYEKDKYVIFDNKDFEKIKSNKKQTITIKQFINFNEIDPIYYNKSYYIIPEKNAENEYLLLKKAMEKSKKVAIAKGSLGKKEFLMALRVKNNIMYLHTLFFYENIINIPIFNLNNNIDNKKLKLILSLVNGMSKKFRPEIFIDEYKHKLKQIIKEKIANNEIITNINKK